MKRYRLLDSLRGLALINMILYHALWDLVYMFGINIPWYRSAAGHIWQQAICCTFILISGFCQPFGRKKYAHGFKVLVCSAIITCTTLIFMPDSPILFGVLTLLGSSMILVSALDGILRKINSVCGIPVSFLLFVFTKNIDMGYIGFGKFMVTLPQTLYSNMFTAYLGFPPQTFVSSDYFALLPWIFLFLMGYFLNGFFKKYNLMKLLQKPGIPVLEFSGRHSLIIYMLHQPVIYAVLYLIFRC